MKTNRRLLFGWLAAFMSSPVRAQKRDERPMYVGHADGIPEGHASTTLLSPACADLKGKEVPCDSMCYGGSIDKQGRMVVVPCPLPAIVPTRPLGWMGGKATPNQCPICGTIAQASTPGITGVKFYILVKCDLCNNLFGQP